MAFSFGSTSQPSSVFGGTATTAASSAFGGFGGTGLGTTGTGTTGGFGFGGTTTQSAAGFPFGGSAATTSGSNTGLTFGAPATTAPSTGFSFNFGGGTPASTGGIGFGTSTTTTSAPTFGAGATGFGGLGSTTGFGGFGSTGLGTTSTAFGVPKPAFNFGQPQTTQQPQQPQQDVQHMAMANLAMAVSVPQIFGDERDAVIARWNQVQALWGRGKGFFSQSGGVDFRPDNPYCRFKAVGYSAIPTGRGEEGLVAMVLKKKQEEVAAAQQQVVDTISKLVNKANLSVCVEGMRPIPEDRTELVIYVLERPAQGPAKRIAARELSAFLQQPTQWSQLTSQLSAETIAPKAGWTQEQIKEYLDTPPAGLDPLLWSQAKLDNPDPDSLVPVAMVGFRELQQRLKHQEEETRLHQQRLDVIAGDLSQLQTQHSQTLAKLDDYKRKHLELSHRLLKVIVKQEIYRKLGYAVQVEEEMLKVQLEHQQGELNHPTQFKGRLNELMSQIRMQTQAGFGREEPTYQMDANMQAEIKQILRQQQEGLRHLIDVIKEDGKDLERMEQVMTTSAVGR